MTRHEQDLGRWKIISLVTGGIWRQNCYIIQHKPSGEKLIIDPGSDASDIIETASEFSGELKYVLLTHAHHDHVGAVALVCKHYGLCCQLHKADERLLRQAPLYGMRFAKKEIELPNSYQTFIDSPKLVMGGYELKAMHTPGHTPGSVCFLFDDFVFTGDTLMRESVGRIDLPGGNFEQLVKSVSQLLANTPDEATLFSGHGRPWKALEARSWWKDGEVLKEFPKSSFRDH